MRSVVGHYRTGGLANTFTTHKSRSFATLVYGGAGQLGSAVVTALKSSKEQVYSLDVQANPSADQNFILDPTQSPKQALGSHVIPLLPRKLSAVICVAGGFSMAPLNDAQIFDDLERMHHLNTQTALAAAHLAANMLKEGGLLVLTGSHAALGPTPAMLGYGISKAATHHIIQSLASKGSPLPSGAAVIGVLPTTLDTASNRRDMPSANFADWTPVDFVAQKLADWVKGIERPHNGSLISFHTSDKVTKLRNNIISISSQ